MKRGAGRMSVVVGAFAAAVQAVYVLDLRDSPTFGTPIIDERTYFDQACAVAGGERMSEGAFWQPPLFPYLLGQVFRLTGPSVGAARAMLAVIFVVSCVLAARLGRRMFGRTVGWLSGCGLALYGPFIFASQELLPASLAVLLILLSVHLLVSALRGRRGWRWGAFGISVGLAVLNVPNAGVLAFIGMFAAAVAGRSRREGRDDARRRASFLGNPASLTGSAAPLRATAWAGATLAGLAAVVLPVTVRNWRASGEYVVVACNGGINFFIGNNADVQQTLAARPGPEWDRLVRAPLLEGMSKHGAQSAWFARKAWAWAAEHPGAFAAGLARKGVEVVNSREIPRNSDVYAARDTSWVLTGLVWRVGPVGFPWAVAAAAAAIGAAVVGVRLRMRRTVDLVRWLPIAVVGLYLASVAVFFVSARYRLPVVPFVLMLGAAGAVRMLTAWRNGAPAPREGRGVGNKRSRRKGTRIRGAIVAGAASLAVTCLPIRHPTDDIDFRSETWRYVGAERFLAGDVSGAEEAFQGALRYDPTSVDALLELGRLGLSRGDVEAAEGFLSRIAGDAAESPEALRLSGDLASARGRLREAEGYYQRSVIEDPTYVPGYAALGALCLHQGRSDDAERWLRKAVEFGDRSGGSAIRLGDVLAADGRYAEAVRFYRRGVSLAPPDAGILNRVAWLLATCPDRDVRDAATAVDLAEAALRMTGDDPGVLGTLAAAYAASGRRADAEAALARGIRAARRRGDTATAKALTDRLARLNESSGGGS
ncbi:MAG: tetratricopeptide repeat protein [Phycisphaerae bacterium]|nr:MAG: hypothetical protein EDS66_04320 [Planctomycetota bacterium]KAB2946864.1 MAG: tetratricopeptide repeat protein [Phycisphaerae bacterium]MBE7457042.1 tetratricopeptide repeat protein [Planctomycetia bacterium]MCK6463600.1 tetratricopeptide repeat protein [Phycisphaerae bacterium]MCL4718268.1 tetratricopeptide repeat protein [Phycisphaerae bacterium]